MTIKELAEFYKVHPRTVHKWGSKKRHQKTTQAQADVPPDEWRLIGEIIQLVYLYNAKGWNGEAPMKWCSLMMNSMQLLVSFFDGGDKIRAICINFSDTNAAAQMELLKRQLEQLIY